MSNPIYNYALIKSLYDEGEDYLDSFWPFVVMTIPPQTSNDTFQPCVDINAIQAKVKAAYNLNMPLHVLAILLARAQERRYIERAAVNPPKYFLSGVGYSYVNKIENDKSVERRIASLLDSVKRFFASKGIFLNNEDISDLVTHFIQVNLGYLISCINPKADITLIDPPRVDGNEKYLLEYLQVIDKQEPTNYEILESMVMGSIISSLLYMEEPEEIKNIEKTKFSNIKVYVDTNFLFSFLGMHMDEFTEPAEELVKLLKDNNFQIKIFSFTIDEVTAVLSAYDNESYKYPTSIRIESLYSALKRKNWTRTDVREFIINIEHTLELNGIGIDWVDKVNLRNYQVSEELRNSIRKYKADQTFFSQNHDLAAIETIREIRQNPIRRLEDAKAFFLTSDGKLSKFNFEASHKNIGTICEVVLDRLFTNIIWLKNPQNKIPLKSIIAAHSHELFVNRRVWERFFKVLQNLKKNGQVTDDAVATLFLHNYLEDALKTIDEVDIDTISDKFVLKEIEKICAKKEEQDALKDIVYKKKAEKYEEKIKALEGDSRIKEFEFVKNLEAANAAKFRAEQAEKEWAAKVSDIKANIRKSAQKSANLRINILRITFVLVFVFLITFSLYQNIQLQYLSLGLSVVGITGITGIWAFVSKKRDYLFNKIYERKLKEANLENLSGTAP